MLQCEAIKTVVLQFIMCRRSREDLELRRAEERARQNAEAQRLIEEKRRREEEEQRRAEEERAEAMREAALLQKQVGRSSISSVNKNELGQGFLIDMFYSFSLHYSGK